MAERTDEELYRLMKRGDRAAFAELYERREPALYRYAWHVSGSSSVAEEVTHEVFLRLMAPDCSFDERCGRLEAWLYGVARNLTRVARRQTVCGTSGREPVSEEDLLGELIKNESTEALLTALRALPVRYRDVVILCELEERTYEDASRVLDCAVGTVRSRLHRARILLAAKLQGAQFRRHYEVSA